MRYHLAPVLSIFIYFEREHKQGWGTEREGDRGSTAGLVLTAENPMQGLNSRTMRSWPELKSDTKPTEPLRRPSSHSSRCLLSLDSRWLTADIQHDLGGFLLVKFSGGRVDILFFIFYFLFFIFYFLLDFFKVISMPNIGLKLTTPRSRVTCDWASQVPQHSARN